MATQRELTLVATLKDEVTKGLEKITSKLGVSEKDIAKMSKTGAVAFAALGGTMLKTASDFANFDTHIQMAGANVSATEDQLNSFREVAKQVGLTTKFSATEAAEALFFLAGGSITAEEAQYGLIEATKLAASGELNLRDAVILAGDAMSRFGIETEEATKISDIFIKATTEVQQTMPELDQAFKQVASTAAQFGLTFEDTTALISQFADAGIRGFEGGTMLKNVITQLTAPNEKAAKAMKELGIETYNADGSARDMFEVIRDGVDAFQDLTDKERAYYGNLIFGRQAIRGWNILVDQGVETMLDYSEMFYNAEGAAQAFTDRVNDARNPMEIFGSILEFISLTIGEQFLPILQDLGLKLIPIIERIGKWIQENPALVKTITVVVAALTALAGIVALLYPVFLAIKGAVAIFAAIKVVVLALMGPIGLVIAAVALLAAGVYMFIKHWDQIKEWWQNMWQEIWLTIEWTGEQIKKWWEGVKEGWKNFWQGLGNVLSAAWENIKTTLATAWEWVKVGFGIVWEALKAGAQKVLDVLSFIFSLEGFFKILGFLAAMPLVIGAYFIKLVSVVYDTMKKFFTETLPNTIKNGIEAAKKVIESFRAWAVTTWENIKNTFKNGVENIKTFLTVTLPQAATNGFNAFKQAIVNAWEWIKTTVTVTIPTAFTNMLNSLRNWGTNIWATISAGLTTARTNIFNWARSVVDGIINFFTSLPNRLKNAVSSAVSTAVNSFKSGWGTAVEWAKSILPFADGGVVTQPTLGLIGEAGMSEAVIPLDQLFSFMAKEFGGGGGEGGTSVNVHISGGYYLDRNAGKKLAESIGDYLRLQMRI